ncbi:MAG: leucine-rich repeat domain-containing protein [Nonlabens sp.]|uniref:leucine-rich repeat domain-containing protein n=1 Tax=Nonlabens sp. TaxID=1888209 RepID=UPI003EF1218C
MRFIYRIIFLAVVLASSSCVENLSDPSLKAACQEAVNNENWTKAIKCVDELLKRNPQDTTLYYSKATYLNQLKNPDSHSEIINNLDIYLAYNHKSIEARLFKYGIHYKSKEHLKALEEIEIIESYYGITNKTLLLKAYSSFLNKDFVKAAFYFEEVAMYPINTFKFKDVYYYKIYSKYFDGNKSGAIWDTAFLPNYGLNENPSLMDQINEGSLIYEDYNEIHFDIDIPEFIEHFKIDIGLPYDRLYRPLYQRYLFQSKKHNLNDLNSVNKEIEILNLSNLNLTALPKETKRFKNLKGINLSGNNFKDLNQLFNDLSEFENLEFVSLNRVNLKNLSSSIKLLKNIKGISMDRCNIKSLPAEISHLKNLSYLSLRGNSRLHDLPKEIRYLKNLNVLDVSGGGIKRLRNELAYCYNLYAIIGNASQIKTLPKDINLLKRLRYANLAANKIETIPEEIGELRYLEDLSLGSNEIQMLPSSFKNLQNLETISLDFNRLKEFPSELIELKSMRSLWLHNNNIPSIPIEVAHLENLTHLLVDHEIISDQNIQELKDANPNLRVIKQDGQRYVKGIRRKK